jgi:hypothetical protein
LPNNLTLSEVLRLKGLLFPGYCTHAALPARTCWPRHASEFTERKYDLDHEQVLTALVDAPDRRAAVRWENFASSPIDVDRLDTEPAPSARHSLACSVQRRSLSEIAGRDFVDWVYRTARVVVRVHQELAVFAGPDIPQAEFRRLCAEQARQRRM